MLYGFKERPIEGNTHGFSHLDLGPDDKHFNLVAPARDRSKLSNVTSDGSSNAWAAESLGFDSRYGLAGLDGFFSGGLKRVSTRVGRTILTTGSGAAAGFLMTGTPIGAIAGGGYGLAKGVKDVTRGAPPKFGRTLYQSAVGAGIVATPTLLYKGPLGTQYTPYFQGLVPMAKTALSPYFTSTTPAGTVATKAGGGIATEAAKTAGTLATIKILTGGGGAPQPQQDPGAAPMTPAFDWGLVQGGAPQAAPWALPPTAFGLAPGEGVTLPTTAEMMKYEQAQALAPYNPTGGGGGTSGGGGYSSGGEAAPQEVKASATTALVMLGVGLLLLRGLR